MKKPQTITEKILSAHAGKAVYADELTIVKVDGIMASDTTAPMAIKAFREMGGQRVFSKEKTIMVIDHASPAPNERIGNLHKFMREFVNEQDCVLYDVGEGICHQLVVENAHVKPGDLFIGADSHTVTYGCLNAFATGVGSTDLAGVMLTGKIWLKVPRTIKFVLNGRLKAGVSAKDVILFLAKHLTIEGATYQAIEFEGPIVERMTLSSRMTMCNMVIEMGAKNGICHPAGLHLPYDWTPTLPDEGAVYERVIEFDLSDLKPQLAFPNSPDNVHDAEKAVGTPIQFAFMGSCTNARLEDLQIAATIMKGKKVAKNVRFLVAPASNKVFMDALADGTAQVLMEAGAKFITSGCGPCVGSHLGVPGDGETVISSTNRNFRGRMGNPNSEVYLGSPAVVAASALEGFIALPEGLSVEGAARAVLSVEC
ncbi:MAG: 3-isopropylmalate dehydratase large subunit [Runella slithyformis]|nr:MAG: 3-isopropylmalate dehydratase large subunit [Runella slithyformis]TAF26609.1 MAG: 3-isopropylmalate dehydratase large subunit [Runella slithyformis]TAF45377.1 MAG: 3-isopropylmalate dehydratase large subunit [Runella slithyformis]